ncbi:MAG: histidine kinase [Streptosporangiaceae bacterium]
MRSPLDSGATMGPAEDFDERRLMAFANAAASVACSGSLSSTLERVAAEVVRATCMSACQVFLVDADTLSMRMIGAAGHPIFPSDFPKRFEQARRRGADLRTLVALRTGETQISRGRTHIVLTDPAWEPLRPTMAAFSWDTYVSVPLAVRDRSLGVLNGFYPPEHDPSEAELSFLRAMSDQAAIAVENARLLGEAEVKAAWEERQRIARELHDSVCQSLFSLSLRVRALQLAMEREWPDPETGIRDDVAAARRLAQATLAEMRSLVLELRPEAVTELGLVPAVRQHATAVGAREGLAIEVRGDLRARLADETVGNLYRVCQEALNNVVKHASATAVDIVFSETVAGLVLEIRDDGAGFDATAEHPGRLGLVGMRERADRIGADLSLQSTPGRGTCVRVRLELDHSVAPGAGVEGQDR